MGLLRLGKAHSDKIPNFKQALGILIFVNA